MIPSGHSTKNALIVFAKAPVAGNVKTRLSPLLTEEEAANLYGAFLQDALQAYSAKEAFGLSDSVAVRLYLPAGDELPAHLVPESATLHRQKGESLGPRMLRAFVETFSAGFERIVVVGTDHPTLPPAFVGEAFRALAQPLTITIGPSADGGYYLLGMNDLYPSLFEMEYSHQSVFGDTMARAGNENAHTVILPEWYDVDDVQALRRLFGEWRAGAVIHAHTESALRALLEAHPKLF